jgi:hypothetical protein
MLEPSEHQRAARGPDQAAAEYRPSCSRQQEATHRVRAQRPGRLAGSTSHCATASRAARTHLGHPSPAAQPNPATARQHPQPATRPHRTGIFTQLRPPRGRRKADYLYMAPQRAVSPRSAVRAWAAMRSPGSNRKGRSGEAQAAGTWEAPGSSSSGAFFRRWASFEYVSGITASASPIGPARSRMPRSPATTVTCRPSARWSVSARDSSSSSGLAFRTWPASSRNTSHVVPSANVAALPGTRYALCSRSAPGRHIGAAAHPVGVRVLLVVQLIQHADGQDQPD